MYRPFLRSAKLLESDLHQAAKPDIVAHPNLTCGLGGKCEPPWHHPWVEVPLNSPDVAGYLLWQVSAFILTFFPKAKPQARFPVNSQFALWMVQAAWPCANRTTIRPDIAPNLLPPAKCPQTHIADSFMAINDKVCTKSIIFLQGNLIGA